MSRTIPALLAAFALTVVAGPLSAGPLNPPAGAVTSTLKTLTEVEPRIAINTTNTPGDATSVHVISQPGSYYLTGNLVGAAGKTAIRITVSDVTLDLNGFDVIGVPGATTGILVGGAGLRCVEVRNGTIRDWPSNGLNGSTYAAVGLTVRSVRVQNNGAAGMWLGASNLLIDCVAIDNGGAGFSVSSDNRFVNCTAKINTGAGFGTAAGAALSGCTSSDNAAAGFLLGSGSIVSECTATLNANVGFNLGGGSLIRSCSASSNGNVGILGASGCRIENNTLRGNSLDGIRITDTCFVSGNACTVNGSGATTGAGIHATGNDNRIESNTCADADTGIDVDGGNNFIVRNTCSGNATNWAVAAGNRCLVVVGTNAGSILGDSGGVSPGSTDPNANFTH